jgi:predicted phage terminase large subunit-like protein
MDLKKKMTQKEFQQEAASIMMKLTCEVTGFYHETKTQKAKRIKRAAQDPMFFCRTYLPHYFKQAPAPFHYELVELMEKKPVACPSELQGNEQQRINPAAVVTPVVVAAPREFAKTTLCSFGYVLHQICFRKRHFIVIGSDTEDLASDLTGYIYLELLYNDRIRQDFGVLVKSNKAVDDFVTESDIRIKARGRGQRLRGLKHQQWRPDLVILDDLENDINVRNPKIVEDILDWVKSAVYPAVDASGSLFIIGTILRQRSALHQMLSSTEEPYRHFVRRIYRAITPEDTSLWEAKHPLDRLLRQKQLMGTVAFNREKMNEPGQEKGLFQQQWVHFYHPDSLKDRNLIVAGFFDPSIENGASADYKAVVTVGWDKNEMVFYVLDAFIQKTSLEMTLNTIFNRHQEFDYRLFGVEDNLFQRLLLNEFDRLAKERQQILPVRGVTNRIAKETRIATLSPLLERGKIRFIRGQSDQNLLIEQMLYFPSNSINDDGPDALEGAIRMAHSLPVEKPVYIEKENRGFRFKGAY